MFLDWASNGWPLEQKVLLSFWCIRPSGVLGIEELPSSCGSALAPPEGSSYASGRWTLKPRISGVRGEGAGEGRGQRAQEEGAVAESGSMGMFVWGLPWREGRSLDTCVSGIHGLEVGSGSECSGTR